MYTHMAATRHRHTCWLHKEVSKTLNIIFKKKIRRAEGPRKIQIKETDVFELENVIKYLGMQKIKKSKTINGKNVLEPYLYEFYCKLNFVHLKIV